MAAKALKVKVLFYMGKYSEALEAANTFIGDGERALVAPYSAVFTDFSNQELIYTRGFAGTDEVIEFKHTAYSRSVFAKGAVEAAKFLAEQKRGMYDMGDVIRF